MLIEKYHTIKINWAEVLDKKFYSYRSFIQSAKYAHKNNSRELMLNEIEIVTFGDIIKAKVTYTSFIKQCACIKHV